MKDNNEIRNEVEMDFRRFFNFLKKKGMSAHQLLKCGILPAHVMWKFKNDMNISIDTLISVMNTVGANSSDEVVDLMINDNCLIAQVERKN